MNRLFKYASFIKLGKLSWQLKRLKNKGTPVVVAAYLSICIFRIKMKLLIEIVGIYFYTAINGVYMTEVHWNQAVPVSSTVGIL